MKRIISLLLTAALAVTLLLSPAAAASVQPWVQVDGKGTGSQTIRIHGLSGSFDAVQVTLNLDRAPGTFTFAEALSDADTHTAITQEGNSLTLYVASKNQLNQGDAILLGTLTGTETFTVVSASGLKLLDLDDDTTKEWSYAAVSVKTGANTPSSPSTGTVPFTDVKAGDWFYDSVGYVYGAGLMNGTSPTAFSPNQTTTRAMIVTILYRYEGSPAAGASSFRDVAAGQYYAAPVAWAAQNGVVTGYSPTQFGPNDTITREQMAAILYRYAQYKGYDVSGRADLSAYSDGNRVSAYARDAMAWANQAGLINGVDARTLQPGGSATRAQVATILTRFCQTIGQ